MDLLLKLELPILGRVLRVSQAFPVIERLMTDVGADIPTSSTN